ncbi:MAG: methyltransferase domain-containing protein [Magnetococcales bacterium]|nr:methyltransferase domain-containing protein [Magnetococcales bacterium]
MRPFFSEEQDDCLGFSDQDFQQLSAFVQAQCGIQVPIAKRTLLIEVIQERLRQVGKRTFKEYMEWLLGTERPDEELMQFIDAVTIRETDFFHAADHFEFMVKTAIPELIKELGAGLSREFMIWNVGCSTGEEAYTLAMVLQEFSSHYPGIPFKAKVLATDVSSRALTTAASAVYGMAKVSPISLEMKQKYLLKSREPARRLVRIVPEVRAMVKFRRLNIMDADFGLREQMDVIFCRNVIAHFDRPTKEKLVNKFCHYLSPGGYLFMGHSEDLGGLKIPVVPSSVASIYRMPY